MQDASDPGPALALGLLQGLTEFLPVSSSGHLAAYTIVGELPAMSLALMLLLHAATLLATVGVFRRDLWGLLRGALEGLRQPQTYLRSDDGLLVRNVVLASVPTAVMGLGLRHHMEALAASSQVVGLCFLVTAGLLFATRRFSGKGETLSASAALLVGVAQGVAVLPGISRSGATIVVAMALGLSPRAAFRFSFLLSMPVILGATVLELGKPGVSQALGLGAWLGALSALLSGSLALIWLRRLVVGGRLWLFGLYLVPLGCAMLLHKGL